MRRLLFAIAAVATLAPLTAVTAQDAGPVQPYGTHDAGKTVLNILPPGQGVT
jgi:hypothetical protein